MKCTNCGQEVKDGLNFCTACGKPLPLYEGEPKKPRRLLWLLIPILLVAIIIVVMLIALSDKTPVSSEKASDFSEVILKGAWYEYSIQDAFANEWVFFADGTCTSEMRGNDGLRKYDTVYATYSVEDDKVFIYQNGKEYEWEYDFDEDCCWLYFGTDYGSYKLKIFHYAQKITQEKLDEKMGNAPEYVIKLDGENDKRASDEFYSVTNPVDLVVKWDNYVNAGFCCDYVKASSEIYEHLTEYQMEWAFDVYECICCHTIEEAKRHIEYYMDASLIDNIDERKFLEYDGKLYVVAGALGYVSHNYSDVSWYQDADERIYLKATLLNSGGESVGTDRFVIELDYDSYKLIAVESNY